MAGVLLESSGLHKTYRLGKVRVPVLRGLGLSITEGERIAILGASGSGKSTLLHLIGGLDRPDRPKDGVRASIRYRGEELVGRSARSLDAYRTRSVGFVFQSYHLLPELTVLENVLVAAMVGRGRLGFARERGTLEGRAKELLGGFGMGHRLKHRPAELSGGERQRVAIARSLVNGPDLLLADEPTGNLDTATGAAVLDQLDAIARASNQTMVMVTHDAAVAERADRVLHLVDGRMADDSEDGAASGEDTVGVSAEPSVGVSEADPG
ncbi:MAG: ABC transporter ATP-binding protein [Planctomycetota bacterium]